MADMNWQFLVVVAAIGCLLIGIFRAIVTDERSPLFFVVLGIAVLLILSRIA